MAADVGLKNESKLTPLVVTDSVSYVFEIYRSAVKLALKSFAAA